MHQKGIATKDLFAAILILVLSGWYIYHHYLADLYRGRGAAAQRIQYARRYINYFVQSSERLLLPGQRSVYRDKAKEINHRLYVRAHSFPKPLEAISSIGYSRVAIKGWFLALFSVQILPLAGVIWFIRIWVYSNRKEPSPYDLYTGIAITDRIYKGHMQPGRVHSSPGILNELLRDSGPLSRTSKALLEILAAHEKWPASIGGHRAARGGLIDHTGAVLQETLEILKERNDELPLNIVVIAALAHDLGKIVAYKNQDDTWVSSGMYHDRLSAAILSSLPEFHKEYSGIEKEAILLAVRHHHSPLDLQVNVPPLAKKLLKILQKADNIAVKGEGEEGLPKRDISPQLERALSQALPVLNINRSQGGNADGWLGGSTVFILEHALREKIYRYLDEEMRGWFPLGRKEGKVHPLWPVLSDYLASKGLLVKEINSIESNNGFFNLKVD